MLQQMNHQSAQQPRYIASGAANNYSQQQASSQFGSKGGASSAADFAAESGYRAYQQPKTGGGSVLGSAAAYQMDPLSALGDNQRTAAGAADVSQYHPSKYDVLQQNSVGAVTHGGDQGIYSSYAAGNNASRSVYQHRHSYVRQQPTNQGSKMQSYVHQSDQSRYDPSKGRDMPGSLNDSLSQVTFDDGWKQHSQVSHDNSRRAPSSTATASIAAPNSRTSDFAHCNGYGLSTVDTPHMMETNNPSMNLGGSAGATSVWTMSASQLPAVMRPNPDFASPNEVKKAFSVAGEFIWHYFHLMQTQPQMLHCFYCGDSQVAHGSSLWAHPNWHRAMGETDIGALFEEILCAKLSQQSGGSGESLIVRSNVKTLEAQPTRDDGIVMQATGYVETRDMGDRLFAHTVVMKRAQDTGSYVVLHDIFVFLDDLLMNPPVSTRSFGASQVSSAKSVSPTIPDETGTGVPSVNTGLNIASKLSHNSIAPSEQQQQHYSSGKAESPVVSVPVAVINETPIDNEIIRKTSITADSSASPAYTESPNPNEEPQSSKRTDLKPAQTDAANQTSDDQETSESKQPVRQPQTAISPPAREQPPAAPKLAWKTIPKPAPKPALDQCDSPNLTQTGQQDKVAVEVTQTSRDGIQKNDGVSNVDLRTIDSKSYAGRLLTGVRAVPKRLGMVVKRRGLEESGNNEGQHSEDAVTVTPNRTVWVSQMDGVSNTQIEKAVAARLRGCPVEGRVVRIERMRSGPAGVIELDSPECVPMLLEKGLCINGREVRVDLYKQSPSQITREPAGQRQGGFRRDAAEERRGGEGDRVSQGRDDGQARRFKSNARGGRGGRPNNSGFRNQNGTGQGQGQSQGRSYNRGGRAAEETAQQQTTSVSVAAQADGGEGARKRQNK